MNLVTCCMLTLAALSPAPEITGSIVDDNGKPVSGVPISVVAVLANQTIEKTLSGSDGSFHFTDLAPGAYGLEAKSDSACAFSDEIGVTTSVLRASCSFDWLRDCAKALSFCGATPERVARSSRSV